MFGYPYKLFGSYYFMIITNKQLKKTLSELEFLKKYYNKYCSASKKKFSKEYDKRLRNETRTVFRMINEDVDKASELITITQSNGRPLKDRIMLTKLHLIQRLFNLTNRQMESFTDILIFAKHETFSYKTIERAYDDPIVRMVVHNLFVLTCGTPREIDSSADGTGTSLTITKHYRTDRINDLKTGEETSKRKDYLYTVSIIDLDTNLYIGFAAGFKSEKQLFKEAKQMLLKNGFSIKSIRLDKYYSHQTIMNEFNKETKIYIIPKKNATIKGCFEWKKLLKNFVSNTTSYLKEYYKREKSESANSKDKKRCSLIRQKKQTRIIGASITNAVLHNLSTISLYH
jgi:transposase